MKQQKNNSKLIIALSILWGFSLIFANFLYLLGRTDELINALNAMISPTSLVILIMSSIAGWNLKTLQFNINLTKRRFILTAILCLFFFPIGLFFLFGTKKYKELEM